MGERIAVVNASPLIFLARADLLTLLRSSADTVLVPVAVADEIQERGSADPTARALKASTWIEVIEAPVITPEIQAWDLGPGESAVLETARARVGSEAIIDDLAGRRCAAALSLPVRGTLGLVLSAKRRGLVPSARVVVERLVSSGMYLSSRVIDDALKLVGE